MRRISILVFITALAFPIVARAGDEVKKAEEQAISKMKDKSATVRLEGVEAAYLIEETAVTEQYARLLQDSDDAVRTAAIDALKNRSEDSQKRRAAEALARLLRPLSKDPKRAEDYRHVIDALDNLAEKVSVRALLDMEVSEPKETARSRLMAVANVPASQAIDGLIQFASRGRNRGSGGQRTLAIKALQWATGQKIGGNLNAWRTWWREAKSTFDYQAAADRRTEAREKAAKRAARKAARANKKKNAKKKDGKKDDGGKGAEQQDGN